MYAFYGGVPHVTVPDCLKQGVLKCHRYDPDLNPSYAALVITITGESYRGVKARKLAAGSKPE